MLLAEITYLLAQLAALSLCMGTVIAQLLLLLLIAAVTGAKPLTLGNLPAPPSGVPEVEERVPGLEEGGELPPLELPGS